MLSGVLTDFTRSERASSVYTTEFITKMFKEEGAELFDARSASLGHTLQGGIPSPMDRSRAVRFSMKCMMFIEKHHELLKAMPPKQRQATGESAAVITIQQNLIKWVPVQEMRLQADMKNRRGKKAWWEGMKELAEAMVGRPQLLNVDK
jgi:6-phosphofructokinase 1